MNRQQPARQFEDLLKQLQEMVVRLEHEELTLDEAISAYEQSVSIANECTRMLDEAELRISQIDSDSREIREQAGIYQVDQATARALLLGDDEDDLADLLGLDDEE